MDLYNLCMYKIKLSCNINLRDFLLLQRKIVLDPPSLLCNWKEKPLGMLLQDCHRILMSYMYNQIMFIIRSHFDIPMIRFFLHSGDCIIHDRHCMRVMILSE